MEPFIPTMKTIGAIPVSMPSGGVYTSLQRGVVGAAEVLDVTFDEYELFKKKMEQVVDWWTKKVGEAKAEEALKAVHNSQDLGIPSWGTLGLIIPEYKLFIASLPC